MFEIERRFVDQILYYTTYSEILTLISNLSNLHLSLLQTSQYVYSSKSEDESQREELDRTEKGTDHLSLVSSLNIMYTIYHSIQGKAVFRLSKVSTRSPTCEYRKAIERDNKQTRGIIGHVSFSEGGELDIIVDLIYLSFSTQLLIRPSLCETGLSLGMSIREKEGIQCSLITSMSPLSSLLFLTLVPLSLSVCTTCQQNAPTVADTQSKPLF